MAERKFRLHDSKGGAALAIRVTPRSRNNEVSEIMDNGTIRIRLTAPQKDQELNQALINFLSEVLEISPGRIDIIAGQSGREKLVCILDLDAGIAQQRILSHMS